MIVIVCLLMTVFWDCQGRVIDISYSVLSFSLLPFPSSSFLFYLLFASLLFLSPFLFCRVWDSKLTLLFIPIYLLFTCCWLYSSGRFFLLYVMIVVWFIYKSDFFPYMYLLAFPFLSFFVLHSFCQNSKFREDHEWEKEEEREEEIRNISSVD